MWAIIIVTTDTAGFYVADDLEPVYDLAEASVYPTRELAKQDLCRLDETWDGHGNMIVVKVS